MLIDLIKKNRSYRRFAENTKIELNQLLSLVDAARFSPCAANLQKLKFYLSYESVDNDKIFDNLNWAGYLRYWHGPETGERPCAYILIIAPEVSTKHHHVDAGIAAQSILLCATEMGLGGCILASMNKEIIQNTLLLPEDYEIVVAIALGKPSETVVLEEVIDPDDIEYWRDTEGVHHVPKRSLKDILIHPTL
ncbi:MAG: nitroreductase [Candidatus Cloacimonetes bacterium HGW-Cloacimonetes-1]|jgi:nitroreductase|nr:MAG: nitroreductase [Candidatus Cloacimonetes bacterium HGW-Cloacimonetes-1]